MESTQVVHIPPCTVFFGQLPPVVHSQCLNKFSSTMNEHSSDHQQWVKTY